MQADTNAVAETGIFELGATKGRTNFSVDYQYFSTEEPDSIVVLFYAASIPGVETTFVLDNINFDFTSTAIDPAADFFLKVYPNPVQDELLIETEMREYEMRLLNPSGQILMQANNPHSINLEALPDGVYFVEIRSPKEGKRKTVRVVK